MLRTARLYDRNYSMRLLFARLFALPILLLATAATLFAQDTTDLMNFDDIPVDDEGRPPYVGLGGGYLGMMQFMNFDELNALSGTLRTGAFDGQMLLHGGGGIAAVVLIPDLRLGAFGLGGSVEQTNTEPIVINGENYNRTLRFDVGITAAQIDYAIPLTKSLTIFPGAMVGASSYTLELTQNRATDNLLFAEVLSDTNFSGSTAPGAFNRSGRISAGGIYYQPMVNIEYAPISILMLRIGVGYSGFAMGDWTNEAGVAVSGVPEIKADGLTAQLGIFVGLFQQ